MSTIILYTWKEMLRKRVLLLTLIATLLFVLAFWFLAKNLATDTIIPGMGPGTDGEWINRYVQGVFTLIVGFFFTSFVLAFLSIFSSITVIAGEAEQGVLQAMMPRPLSRTHFYLGRWLGYVSLGMGYALLLFLVILGITEYHTTVPSNPLALLKAFLLFASLVPLLVSLSMLGSCYLSAMGNGVLMIMLFGAGWLGGILNKISSMGVALNDTLSMIAGLMDMVMPTDALQRRMLTEMFSLEQLQPFVNFAQLDLGPFGLAGAPSNLFLLYALGYLLLAILLGVRAFNKKDL